MSGRPNVDVLIEDPSSAAFKSEIVDRDGVCWIGLVGEQALSFPARVEWMRVPADCEAQLQRLAEFEVEWQRLAKRFPDLLNEYLQIRDQAARAA